MLTITFLVVCFLDPVTECSDDCEIIELTPDAVECSTEWTECHDEGVS